MRRVLMVVLVTLLAGGPVGAVHDADCGGSWKSSNSCPFELQGFPVEIWGDAAASSGTVRVRVWVVVETPLGDQILTECEAQGNRTASCEAELGIGERIDPYVRSLPLRCRVEGAGGGTFGCRTYTTPV